MKTLLVALLAMTALFQAQAQVSLDLALDQDEFLPSEPIRLAVKITNESGQQLHLGADPGWLIFNVESEDGYIVVKNSDVPVVDPFDLESSQMATKHVNLEPHFQMDKPGRYKVTATMRIKEWGLTVNSAPIHFDVINGGQLWSQNFGVTMATNAPPESRKYTLIKANYLREQLRLYIQVSSGDGGTIYRVAPLGPLVSFNLPEEQVDRIGRLHVLWQTAAQSFSYVTLDADGITMSRDVYDNFNSRPRLTVNTDGEVVVLGGVRRPRPGELPPGPAPMSPSSTSSVPVSAKQ